MLEIVTTMVVHYSVPDVIQVRGVTRLAVNQSRKHGKCLENAVDRTRWLGSVLTVSEMYVTSLRT